MIEKIINNEIKHVCTCVGVQIKGEIVLLDGIYKGADEVETIRKAGEARLECDECNYDPNCRCVFSGEVKFYKDGDIDSDSIILNIKLTNHGDKILTSNILLTTSEPYTTYEYTGFGIHDIKWKPRYWTEAEFEGAKKAPCFIPTSEEYQVGVMYTKNYDINGEPLVDIVLHDKRYVATLDLYVSKNEDICKQALVTKNYVESGYVLNVDPIDLSLPAKFCKETNEKYPNIEQDDTGKCPELIPMDFPWYKDGYVELNNPLYAVNDIRYDLFRKPYYDELDYMTPTNLDGLDEGRGSDWIEPITSQNDLKWWGIANGYGWAESPDCNKKYIVALLDPCDLDNTEPIYFFSFDPGDIHPITGKTLEGYLDKDDFPIYLKWNFPCNPYTDLNKDEYVVDYYINDHEWIRDTTDKLIAKTDHNIIVNNKSIRNFDILVRRYNFEIDNTKSCRDATGLPNLETDYVSCCTAIAKAPKYDNLYFTDNSWAVSTFHIEDDVQQTVNLGPLHGNFFIRYISGYNGYNGCINCMNDSNWHKVAYRNANIWTPDLVHYNHWKPLYKGFKAVGSHNICDCNQTIAHLNAVIASNPDNPTVYWDGTKDIYVHGFTTKHGIINYELRQVCNYIELPGNFR